METITINSSISYLFFSSKTLIIYRYFPSMATHRIDFSKYFESSSRLKKIPVDVSTIRLIPSLRSIGQKVQNVLVNKFMRILALCVFARGSRVINARKSVFRNGRPTVSRGTACNSGSVAVQTVLPLTIMARDRPDRYGKLLVPALIGTLADLLIRFVPPLCLPFGWRASDFAPPLWIFIRPVSLCKMPNYSIYTRWSLTRRVSCF